MTIEVGVVRGNFERVQSELADMLVQMQVKTDNQSELAELEQRIESINVRAETFLKSLGMDDDNGQELADLIKSAEAGSDKKPDEIPKQDLHSPAESRPLDQSVIEAEVQSVGRIEKELKDDIKKAKAESTDPLSQFDEADPADQASGDLVDAGKKDVKPVIAKNPEASKLPELKSITAELANLSDLVASQGNLLQKLIDETNQTESPKKSNSESVDLQYSETLDQYLTIASSDIIKADLEVGNQLIGAINNTDRAELLVSLPEFMTMLKDQVMQPSLVVYSFLKKVLENDLTRDQKNVLNRLLQYQKTSLENARLLNPLPSPWARGMKDLFD